MTTGDFYEQTEEEQLARLSVLADRALGHWRLEGARTWLLKYRENAVFGIEGADGTRYAMRVHRVGHNSDDALRSELEWMAALRADGIGAPPVIPTADGEPFVKVASAGVPEARNVDLLGWVDGTPLGQIEGGAALTGDEARLAYRRVGALAARIHDHGANWKRPEGFVRREMDADGLIGAKGYLGDWRALDRLSAAQRNLFARTSERLVADLEAFGKSPDRYGLTHADFLPENFLSSGERIQIIDFDDCGFGWHLMDLATALFFIQGEAFYEDALGGLVEGYREVRPLPDAQLTMLQPMLVARGLTYLGWCASRSEIATAGELVDGLVVLVEGLATRYLEGGTERTPAPA